MRFYSQKRKERARQEKQASEQGKRGMQAFRQAGKVASWSVGSRALVVSAAAKGRNREGGMGSERGKGKR